MNFYNPLSSPSKMFNEINITEAIRQFYSTTDENLRRDLNNWLTEAQNSLHVWNFAWKLLQTSNDVAVQYFAANCLHRKLADGKMDEYLKNFGQSEENAEVADQFLRRSLIENCARVESKLVKHKLASTLSVYVIHSTPDIWPDAFVDLCILWKPTQPILLLDIFASIPSECGTMSMPVERKAAVRGTLRNRETVVANTVIELLQTYRTNCDIVDAVMKCVETWVDFCHDASDWIGIVAQCLQCATEVGSAAMPAVSKFFCRYVENSDLRKLENFLGQLFDFLAPQLPRLTSDDPDEFEDITNMCISLLENHSNYVFKNLISRPSAKVLLDAALTLTSWSGFYPIDETVSGKTFNIWYSLYEDASAEPDSPFKSAVEPLYLQLTEILLRKLKYPPESVYGSWTAEDRERFASYRSEGSDIFGCCYRILGCHRFLDVVFNDIYRRASEAIKTSGGSEWEEMEVFLYCLESAGDYVSAPCNHNGLVVFLDQHLSNVPFSSPIIANTALRMISKYAHVIGEDKRFLRPILASVVLQFLTETSTVYNATMALEYLTRNGDAALVDDELFCGTVISAALNCFYDQRFPWNDQLRALSSAGYILSIQSNDVVLKYLNEFLAPRLHRLQNVVEGKTAPCTKPELLKEFDILTCLISALGFGMNRRSTGSNDCAIPANPVYLIISQSFDLFENLYKASGGDADVAKKIVDTLKRALSNMGEEAKNLLTQFIRILALLYPPHVSALDFTKPVFLLFANDASLVPTMGSIFNSISETTPHDDIDALEAFLGLCHQLVKKQWDFFKILNFDKSVAAACQIIGNVQSDSPAVRQASQYLCELLTHVDSGPVAEVVTKYGSALLTACFTRLQVELLSSCVEYVADVIFGLLKFNQQTVEHWHRDQNLIGLASNPSIMAMLKEVGNKRKFREYAKQFNIACRKESRNA